MESELHMIAQRLEMSLARVSHLLLLRSAVLIRMASLSKVLMRLIYAPQD